MSTYSALECGDSTAAHCDSSCFLLNRLQQNLFMLDTKQNRWFTYDPRMQIVLFSVFVISTSEIFKPSDLCLKEGNAQT